MVAWVTAAVGPVDEDVTEAVIAAVTGGDVACGCELSPDPHALATMPIKNRRAGLRRRAPLIMRCGMLALAGAGAPLHSPRMALVVQKYGGTSVADADRIRKVAGRVAAAHRAGKSVVVVVSAMGGTTNLLVKLASDVSRNDHPRELDMLLTAGERVSMALCAMALSDLGIPALSLTGSQAGIFTTSAHGAAEIIDIRAVRVQEGIDAGKVVIVAGFQGVDPTSKEITTLGRGGSDATAVALAAALGADECEIYTDVDGVFTADPRFVASAVKLDEIIYEEMLELAGAGAGVLMPRAVEFGRRYSVPIHVRSSFHDGAGTLVKEETMEEPIVRGVAHDASVAKVTIHGVPDKPGVAADLFEPLAAAGINVDVIVQNVSIEGVTDISFTVPERQIDHAKQIAESTAKEIGARGVDFNSNIAKVTLVGAGMKSESGVAAKMFRVLSRHDINIEMISTSQIRISCIVRGQDVEAAVSSLHDAFVTGAVSKNDAQ
jgi:aspartate kinase